MMGKPEDTARVGEELVKHRGIEPGGLGKLHELPYGELMAAARAAGEAANRDKPRQPGGLPGLGWRPTADGTIVAGAPFVPGGPRLDSEIPLLVGCTLNEISPSAYDEALESLTPEALLERVGKTYEADLRRSLSGEEPPGGRDPKGRLRHLRFARGQLLWPEDRT